MRIIELRRGDAEVEQHALQRAAVGMRCHDLGEPTEIGVYELETGVRSETQATGRDRIGVAVERQYGAHRADGLQQPRRVSATAKSRIHIETTHQRGERLERFLDKYRLVPICLLHAYTPHRFAPHARRTDQRPARTSLVLGDRRHTHNDRESSSVDRSVAVSSLLSQ